MLKEEERRSKEHIIHLEIYTDGSCKKVGRIMTCGGWAFIAVQDGKEIYEAAAGEKDTTNQRMELMAIRKALEYAASVRRNNERVTVYSDSAYAINCYLQEWYVKWQSNGWCNAAKKPVANQDLWIEIIPYFDNFWYDFKKVKGHDGVIWNEECDRRAQHQADLIKLNGDNNG